MAFHRENLFLCFQNIWENLEKLSGHIFSIHKSFSTWSCSKYWTKPSKTLSAYFKHLKYFYRKYSQINPRKSSMSHLPYLMILQSFISIPIVLVHQNIPKPSLSRSKHEQIYIVKFLLSIPNIVGMP